MKAKVSKILLILFWIILAVIGLVFYIAVTSPGQEIAQDNTLAKSKVIDLFDGAGEPAALASKWTSSTVFTIVVNDDGSIRNGYAMYACEILRENGLSSGYSVEIIDKPSALGETARNILGAANC